MAKQKRSCTIPCDRFKGLKKALNANWTCDHCTFLKDVEKALDKPALLDLKTRNHTVDEAKAAFEVGTPRKDGFACNILHMTIFTACNLQKCPWWVNNKTAMNCLKQYLTVKEVDNLTPEEFSWLYRIPYNTVRELYNKHLIQIQRIKFKQSLEDVVRWKYVKSKRVCCVCESATDQPFHVEGNLAWCSDQCYWQKEPWLVSMELLFETDAKNVLSCIVKVFKTVNLAQSVLGLTKFQMRIACGRYLGTNMSALFPSRGAQPDGSIKYNGEQQPWISKISKAIRSYRKRGGVKMPPTLRELSKQISSL